MKITEFTGEGEAADEGGEMNEGDGEGGLLKPRALLRDLPVDGALAGNLRGMGYAGLLDHQLQAYSIFEDTAVPADLALPEYERDREEGLVRHAQTDRLLVSFNTSAGKTVLAFLFMDSCLRRRGGLALYCVPYKALADEIASKLERAYRGIWRVGISTGDYTSFSLKKAARYDVVVVTYDKLNSLLRKDPDGDLRGRVSSVTLDEFHLINGEHRGPVIEDVVIKLRAEQCALIALSATVGNRRELGEWLSLGGRECLVVHSNFRPVELRRGIFVHCNDPYIEYEDGSLEGAEILDENAYVNAAAHFLKRGISTIFFRQSRGNAKATASRVAEWRQGSGAPRGARGAPFSSTSHGEALAEVAAAGCAYHHAGLGRGDKELVERLYRERKIDFLASTTTLSTGINIPAAAGLVEFMRYDPDLRRMAPIPKNECLQCLGRIGRPQYDSEGIALLLLNGEGRGHGWIGETTAELMERYFEGGPDPIVSFYHRRPHLSSAVLGAVAGGYASTIGEVREYVAGSLSKVQSPSLLGSNLDGVLEALSKGDRPLLEIEGEGVRVTKMGRLANSLYLQPATAALLLDAVERLPEDAPDLALVFWAALTPDFRTFYIRRSQKKVWRQLLEAKRGDLGVEEGEDEEADLEALMTATVLVGSEGRGCAWALESDVKEIERRWLVQAGDLQSLVGGRGSAEWILHALGVFARARGRPALGDRCRDLGLRVRHGVREELLSLVKIRGVGRKRGRALYRAGFGTSRKVAGAPVPALARVTVSGRALGEKLAARIKAGAETMTRS
jgi:helicase